MASASSWLLDQVDEAAKLLWSGGKEAKDVIKGLLRILAAAEIHADKHGAVSVPIRKLLQQLPRRGGSGLSPFHCIRKLSTFRAVWGKFGASLDINAKDKAERKTLLHHVARNIKNGNEYVKFLLECNAAPDSKDRYGWTPLHDAARTGNDSVLRELLQHTSASALSSCVDADGHTPLHVAAYMAHLNATRLLAKRYMSDLGTQPRQLSSQNVTSVVTKRRHALQDNADSSGVNVSDNGGNGVYGSDSGDGSGGLRPNKRRRVSINAVSIAVIAANPSAGAGGDGDGDGNGDADAGDDSGSRNANHGDGEGDAGDGDSNDGSDICDSDGATTAPITRTHHALPHPLTLDHPLPPPPLSSMLSQMGLSPAQCLLVFWAQERRGVHGGVGMAANGQREQALDQTLHLLLRLDPTQLVHGATERVFESILKSENERALRIMIQHGLTQDELHAQRGDLGSLHQMLQASSSLKDHILYRTVTLHHHTPSLLAGLKPPLLPKMDWREWLLTACRGICKDQPSTPVKPYARLLRPSDAQDVCFSAAHMSTITDFQTIRDALEPSSGGVSTINIVGLDPPRTKDFLPHIQRHIGMARIPCDIDVYIAQAGSGSYGWHFDVMDNLVICCSGKKRFRVGGTRVGIPPVIDHVMSPGDAIYIPARVYHCGIGHPDHRSILLSVGFRSQWMDMPTLKRDLKIQQYNWKGKNYFS